MATSKELTKEDRERFAKILQDTEGGFQYISSNEGTVGITQVNAHHFIKYLDYLPEGSKLLKEAQYTLVETGGKDNLPAYILYYSDSLIKNVEVSRFPVRENLMEAMDNAEIEGTSRNLLIPYNITGIIEAARQKVLDERAKTPAPTPAAGANGTIEGGALAEQKTAPAEPSLSERILSVRNAALAALTVSEFTESSTNSAQPEVIKGPEAKSPEKPETEKTPDTRKVSKTLSTPDRDGLAGALERIHYTDYSISSTNAGEYRDANNKELKSAKGATSKHYHFDAKAIAIPEEKSKGSDSSFTLIENLQTNPHSFTLIQSGGKNKPAIVHGVFSDVSKLNEAIDKSLETQYGRADLLLNISEKAGQVASKGAGAVVDGLAKPTSHESGRGGGQ